MKCHNMGKKGTETSKFGVSKRESHDSSKFYSSNLYQGLEVNDEQKIIDNSSKINESVLNKDHFLDDNFLNQLPPNSIHLLIIPVNSIFPVKNFDTELVLIHIGHINSYWTYQPD